MPCLHPGPWTWFSVDLYFFNNHTVQISFQIKVLCLSFQSKSPRLFAMWSKMSTSARIWAVSPYSQNKKSPSFMKEKSFTEWSIFSVMYEDVDLLDFPASTGKKVLHAVGKSHLGSSSSIGTSRFPKYQKIHKTRLRNMRSGPEKTKKSQ